ncbi:MAG TPA: DUF3124 domain-containing protein [Gallionellaceae bacterium]
MHRILLPLFALALSCLAGNTRAEDAPLSRGQTLYLPIYSHIWHGDVNQARGEPMRSNLSALVSIRNTSLKTPLRLLSARYYNTEGKLLKEFIASPRSIPPMGTVELFIEKSESEGGSGANFIIQWEAATATNPPVVEAVHIDNQASRPYSFVTTARVIQADK